MLSPARARFWIEKAEAAWPLASASAADAALERGDALLEHVRGRVHDAGVDVAELLEREQIGGVLGALELIGGGLVDRHRDSARRRIGAPASVKRQSFDFMRHGFFPAVAACVASLRSPDATDEGDSILLLYQVTYILTYMN